MSSDRTGPDLKARAQGLGFHYGPVRALKGVDLPVVANEVTCLIGPSGCGKSTLLRCFNRLHDLYPGHRYEGSIQLQPDGVDLLAPGFDPVMARLRIGMVFQTPNPFPSSVFENIAFGLRVAGEKRPLALAERVETALREAALWDEVKDRLDAPALSLSGGQQQRLCIARALATQPEMLLFDEPTSALDPAGTAHIEALITELKQRTTILLVTHNLQQAGRVSRFAAFMYRGEVVEYGETERLFTRPARTRTENFITGRFG
ncbi:MAG: phosphate ABC transporter ATP-binding protein [Lysobacteraceae bacterium]